MGIKGRTPREGPQGLTFTHDKCHGKPRTGWLSGDVHVLDMHVGKGKSKPCERVLLGTNHPCPGCAAQRAVDEIGFVPLRDHTGRPVCVLVRKQRIPFIAKMERGCTVYYGREEGDFESVYVTPALKDLPWKRYFTCEPRDDMAHWLPLFLGTPHLAAAMRAYFAGEAECQPVVTEVPPVVTKRADALPPTTAELEGVDEALPFVVPLAETTRRIDAKKERERRNAEFVSRNGKPQ